MELHEAHWIIPARKANVSGVDVLSPFTTWIQDPSRWNEQKTHYEWVQRLIEAQRKYAASLRDAYIYDADEYYPDWWDDDTDDYCPECGAPLDDYDY